MKKRLSALLASCLLLPSLLLANTTAGNLPSHLQAQAMQLQQQSFQEPTQRSQRTQPGTLGPLQTNQNENLTPEGARTPFGADLFNGGFRGVRADGMNPDYRMQPGDQVTLRIWGAVQIDRVIPVDAQGNLFIPSIGPIQVAGVSQAQLDNLVRAKVREFYPENVFVYTNLQGVQPVSVFVTGFVKRPGQFAGIPADSVLHFLDQAGGVDEQLGSYRRISIRRNDTVVASIDLYQFLLSGKLEHPQFQSGDTIVVDRRGPVIFVDGDVGRAHQFELNYQSLSGNDVMLLAQLNPTASHALVRGVRQQQPFANYHTLLEFGRQELYDGDEILFMADKKYETIVVQLEGSYSGRSHFVLPKEITLLELLDNIPVRQGIADIQSVSIRRVSVAEKQKQSLQDSLRRLETTFLSAPSSTVEESAIRVREAELISQFVAKASQVEPNGRLVVSHNDNIRNIRLQDGDVITIPEITDAILISGEVFLSQSMVFQPGMSVDEYIRAAGGFTQHADRSRILIVRQNGEVRDSKNIRLRPGDEIMVLPKADTKNLQLATTISQILYQIAIAAKVALDL